MAANYDNVASGSVALADTYPTINFNITQNNSGNTGVLLFITWTSIVGLIVASDNQGIITITYDGNDMSYVGTVTNATHTTDVYWYPNSSGTKAINIVFDNLDNPGSTAVITAFARAITVYNVAQTSSVYQALGNTGTGTSISRTLTTNNANNLLVDGVFAYSGYCTIAVTGSGQTQRFNSSVGGKGGYMRVGSSTKQATAGSDTMSWSVNISRPWGTIVVELVGVAVSTVPNKFSSTLSLMGIG